MVRKLFDQSINVTVSLNWNKDSNIITSKVKNPSPDSVLNNNL